MSKINILDTVYSEPLSERVNRLIEAGVPVCMLNGSLEETRKKWSYYVVEYGQENEKITLNLFGTEGQELILGPFLVQHRATPKFTRTEKIWRQALQKIASNLDGLKGWNPSQDGLELRAIEQYKPEKVYIFPFPSLEYLSKVRTQRD